MSAGHRHSAAFGLNSQALDRLLADRAVCEALHRYKRVNRDFDLPFLAGYSRNGETIYIDRHLPEEIGYDIDGRRRIIAPERFLVRHESLEKALIDSLGYGYDEAHRAATGYEKRGVLMAGDSWTGYSKSLKPFIKADEHERLEKVPSDLDMTPYMAAPVDHALVERMQAAMGAERKHSKAEASYGAGFGTGSRHCGPRRGWVAGDCLHFEVPRSCDLVRGAIAPEGACRYWEAKR